jgi:hypothetical protein
VEFGRRQILGHQAAPDGPRCQPVPFIAQQEEPRWHVHVVINWVQPREFATYIPLSAL